jgi:hypothetical protein
MPSMGGRRRLIEFAGTRCQCATGRHSRAPGRAPASGTLRRVAGEFTSPARAGRVPRPGRRERRLVLAPSGGPHSPALRPMAGSSTIS